ncbi:MAG: FAD-dependent oxidoreductase [Actinobacteria bacterium]|nr:FAD-dependent oxidoreductase [Actinomycetota bacterium]
MSDVVVYGATAAGVAAAVGAQDAGAQVTLLEPGSHIGGMVSGGLGWTDVGDERVLGGFARRFYAAVAEHYGAPLWALRGPEPHVAESILTSMLGGVDVRLGEREPPDAAVYVDASYEGDLLPRFGVPYAVGRESRELYGERWAGRQPATRPGKHNFRVLLSPFDDDGALLPYIKPPELDERGWPVDRLGEGDGGLQAYGYRVCLTDRAENRVPFEAPPGYDPGAFELLRRLLHSTDVAASDLLGLVTDLLPNGKCDVNSIGPFSLNLLDGSNRSYPDGDVAAREYLREHHLRYAQAFLYFLANDDDVPARVRAEVARWGLCADEFTDTGGWPHQLYVRDGRRMLGDYVLVEDDLCAGRVPDDSIGLGSYNIDIREVERTWRGLPEYARQDAVFNEGYLSVAVPPYGIPFRTLTPQRGHATNLLVAVCVSASHVAFGSVRMEPTLMLLGHAAGLAAAQAARRSVDVQDVDVRDLQDSLRREGQVLTA